MIGGIAILVVLMVLPLSALATRRLPLASWVRMALAWMAIFAMLFLVVSLWQATVGSGGALAGLFRRIYLRFT